VTEVRHTGRSVLASNLTDDEPTYENRFVCAPAYVSCRPKRRRPRVQQVLETAVVAGPVGEEIYTDQYGRVKVQFHWDRTGAANEHSSCWIRISQAWAGAAWGFQFVPRIGMEVLVSFVGGDADRPMILGAAYNATHPVPFLLPRNKTISGIRTQSTPGGGGFNELSFEDAASLERIYVHAQRDYDELVRRNHTLHVVADETLAIDANRHDTVGKNVTYEVFGNREETVHGDTSVRHVGARVDVVEKTLDHRVTGMRTTRIEDRDDLEVRGPAQQRNLDDLTMRVLGNQTVIVGKHEAPRSLTLRVEGVGSISAEGVLELASAKGITLRCGKTTLRIGEDGIELVGGTIRAAGEKGGLEASKDGLKLTSDKVYAHLGDQMLLKTDQASMSMGTEVKIDGAQILLNSPSSGKDAPPPKPKPPTEIELKDTDGNPLAAQRFVIELDDGSQRTGVTDKDGKAKLDLPSGGKIRFHELSEVKSS
jgi:type VI secretion system secreted protein VgrG